MEFSKHASFENESEAKRAIENLKNALRIYRCDNLLEQYELTIREQPEAKQFNAAIKIESDDEKTVDIIYFALAMYWQGKLINS